MVPELREVAHRILCFLFAFFRVFRGHRSSLAFVPANALQKVICGIRVIRGHEFSGFRFLLGICVLGFGISWRRQCPWPKIIHQDQATAILSNAVALHPAEVCEQAKLESVAQRHEEIVLVTRQNVTRLQTFQRRGQSFARIGQGHAQDREIYFLVGRQLRKCSTGIDVDTLAVQFDQKRQRFAANPISRALRHARLRPIKWHFAEKPVVRGWQNANFPWSDSPHISGFDCFPR